MSAREVFEACCRYLLAAGWYRDGDDPGLWSLDTVAYFCPLDEALVLQLEADGVSMLEAVA